MKFAITREALLHPLQVAYGIVDRRQTQPVLSNLLLEAGEEELCITSTDREIELMIRVSEVEIDEPGATTVPAKKLVDICRSMRPGTLLTMTLEENMSSGSIRLSVTSGRFQSYLATLPPVEFPVVTTDNDSVHLQLNTQLLSELLNKTSFAMAQKDVRQFLNGVLIQLDGRQIRTVATNGLIMATTYCDCDTIPEAVRIIVPGKGVTELLRLLNNPRLFESLDSPVEGSLSAEGSLLAEGSLSAEGSLPAEGSPPPPSENLRGEVELWISSNHLRVQIGCACLTTNLIDGEYPNYRSVIPKDINRICKVDKAEFHGALFRTSILSNELYRDVRLSMEGMNLNIHANNPLQEEADETISIEYEGTSLKIDFDVRFLLEALSVMNGEQVKIEFSGVSRPCVLTDPENNNALYVVSPMKDTVEV